MAIYAALFVAVLQCAVTVSEARKVFPGGEGKDVAVNVNGVDVGEERMGDDGHGFGGGYGHDEDEHDHGKALGSHACLLIVHQCTASSSSVSSQRTTSINQSSLRGTSSERHPQPHLCSYSSST
jgi:hypothetical protein